MTALVLVAYVGNGRFAVPKKAPVLDVAEMERAADPEEMGRQVEAGLKSRGAGFVDPVTAEGGRNELVPGLQNGLLPMGVGTSEVCALCDAVPFLP